MSPKTFPDESPVNKEDRHQDYVNFVDHCHQAQKVLLFRIVSNIDTTAALDLNPELQSLLPIP